MNRLLIFLLLAALTASLVWATSVGDAELYSRTAAVVILGLGVTGVTLLVASIPTLWQRAMRHDYPEDEEADG
jgi:uncharacterized membrane protein